MLDLIALICILAQVGHPQQRAAQFFLFVTISSFLIDGLIMFLTLCHVTQSYVRTPLIEMGVDALWILFYLIGASLLLSTSSVYDKPFKAGGVMGIFNIIVRFVCIGLNMLAWKRLRKPANAGEQSSTSQNLRIRY